MLRATAYDGHGEVMGSWDVESLDDARHPTPRRVQFDFMASYLVVAGDQVVRYRLGNPATTTPEQALVALKARPREQVDA